MPIPIILPKFGFTLESCEMLEWLVAAGDVVREGDPLAEVETDKVNMEVEATADGTVFHLLYDVGDDVPVTEVIAFLLAPGENPPDDWQPPAKKHLNADDAPPATPAPNDTKAEPERDPVTATPVARRVADENNVDLAGIIGTGPRGRVVKEDVQAALAADKPRTNGKGSPVLAHGKVPATPAARRLAAEMDIELKIITGSGPNGRIQGVDVQRAFEAAAAPAEKAEAAPVTSASSPPDGEPLRGMRRRIAERMQQSFRDVPHVFFDATIDMREILSLRETIKAREESLSVTAIIAKACAHTLMQHPAMNSTFDGERVTAWNSANVGVAVALEDGLIVPVIHHADTLPLRAVQSRLTGIVARARAGKLTPDDVSGGTFTVSNLGMYGVDRFTAIINPPQVGIVAVGRTVEQFVPDENSAPVLRPQMTLTVSADHRVVDGAGVAQFLRDLKATLEDPTLMLW